MLKLNGRKITALLFALIMVMSCGVFSFADGSADSAKKEADDEDVIVTLGEVKSIMPPEAPKEKPAVMFNGEYVDFTDAKPVNINGRIMVPFRAVLEAMGADVNYDGKTKEITASLGGKEIAFKAGVSELTVKNGGNTKKVSMDVVPFTDAYTKRTYVSSRFVAEAFGYSVGWDNAYKTVAIIDFEPFIKEAPDKFSIIGLMFDGSKIDYLRPYRTSGDFDMDITIGDDAMKALKGAEADVKPVKLGLSGKIDGTVQGKQGITNEMLADIGMVFELDADDLMKALELKDTANGNLWELILSDLSMDIKMDGKDMYIRMPALDYLMLASTYEGAGNSGDAAGIAGSSGTGKDVWYKIPMDMIYGTYDEMGIDFEELMGMAQEANNMEGYLRMLAAMFGAAGEPDAKTYYELQIASSILNTLIGDEAFTTAGTGSTRTHTLNFDMNSFIELAKIVDEEDAANEILKVFSEIGADFSINITIREKNESLDNYSLKMNIDIKDKFSLAADQSGNLLNENARITMKIGNYLDFTMRSSEKTQNTSKVPDVSVPNTAKIIDFAEMMQY